MKNRSHGFTLMELMVVLSIAAAVLVLGAPNFNQFRLNNRLTNTANDMLSATVLARTEAIKRQQSIALCPSGNPTAAEPTCTEDSNAGWIVFVDEDGNCERSNDEPLIDSRPLDTANVTNPLNIRYDGSCLSFAPTGFRQDIPDTTTLGRILICDKRGIEKQAGLEVSAARGIMIAPTGRARITRSLTGGLSDDISTWGAGVACP